MYVQIVGHPHFGSDPLPQERFNLPKGAHSFT